MRRKESGSSVLSADSVDDDDPATADDEPSQQPTIEEHEPAPAGGLEPPAGALRADSVLQTPPQPDE